MLVTKNKNNSEQTGSNHRQKKGKLEFKQNFILPRQSTNWSKFDQNFILPWQYTTTDHFDLGVSP